MQRKSEWNTDPVISGIIECDLLSSRKAILIAQYKGYRVLESGEVIGLKGNPIKIKLRGEQKYPTVSVNVGSLTKSGVYGIPAHWLAAYYYYGAEALREGVEIRHLNGDTLDISKKNLALGTPSENNMDKPPEVRRRAAIAARKAQGYRAKNSYFTNPQVVKIRESHSEGTSLTALAQEYNVTKQCIHRIVTRRSYKDVE